MEELITYIVTQLSTDKEAVKITKYEAVNAVRFTIHPSKDDMGKIIGKDGKVIQSIRTLVKILAVKEKKYVTITISEPETPTPAASI